MAKTMLVKTKNLALKHKVKSITAVVLAVVLIIWGAVSCGSPSFYFGFVRELNQASALNIKVDTVYGRDIRGGETVDAEDSHGFGEDVIRVRRGDTFYATLDILETALYNIAIDYFVEHSGHRDTELQVSLDDRILEEQAPLKARWVSRREGLPFDRDDRFGHEISPLWDKAPIWQDTFLYNFRFDTSLPLEFVFEADTTIELRFEVISGGDTLIGGVRAESAQSPPDYADYIANVPSGVQPGEASIVIGAERPSFKNGTMGIPDHSTDPNVYPQRTHQRLLNVLTGMDFPSTEVSYIFSVPRDGLYTLSLSYITIHANRTAFVKISINGQPPFREFMSYPLTPQRSYRLHTLSVDGEPARIFLPKGEHVISIRSDLSLFRGIRDELMEIADEINSIYLDLRRLAGAAGDPNREWNPDSDFPGVVESLTQIREDLAIMQTELRRRNGSEVNWQPVINLEVAENVIRGLLRNPERIASNHARLSEGGGSAMQAIANAITDLQVSPFDLDRFIFTPIYQNPEFRTRSGWSVFWQNVRRFFRSFTINTSPASGDEGTLDVWVFKSRRFTDQIRLLFEAEGFAEQFKEETGFGVNFSILAEEGRLILANAGGVRPDVVLGTSNFLPYEMGIRGLTYDLTRFDDFGEVIGRFAPGSMLPLISDGVAMALPETQDFFVLFYRSDIMERFGIPIPDTWDDVLNILPMLQRRGMNFFIPLSGDTAFKPFAATAPFIYQFGGDLFKPDGSGTTIGDENSIAGIRFMTELYTLFGLPQQVGNFYDAFRNGSIPIGIAPFDTYLRLHFAAPEIAGRWNIALSPGRYNPDTGVIERWQTGSATTIMIIDNDNEARAAASWEFLKWWTDAQTQEDYMNGLRLRYGSEWLINTSNLEAFKNSPVFPEDHVDVILEQWEWLREVPKVPGWYMLERELSHIWNNVVINGHTVRSSVNHSVVIIDREIRRKLTEFGFMRDGVMLRPYEVTTLETIQRLMSTDGVG